MKMIFSILFPAKADNTIHGMKLPANVFLVIAIISTVRSCIHLFSPDGGAGSIAGLDLSVAGADSIVFAFALWGSAQLVYALIQLLVAVKYRSLVGLMYIILIIEALLRELVGKLKPVSFAHIPPGAIGNKIILPLAVVMLALIIWSELRSEQISKKP